jgi:hypothetical protein
MGNKRDQNGVEQKKRGLLRMGIRLHRKKYRGS